MKIGIYPGTFDPITNGHIDVIKRAVLLFDKLFVSITTNPEKSPLFTINERLAMVKNSIKTIDNVEVENFKDLLVNYASNKNATAIIRGLRAMSDFEFEFQMALINRKLSNNIVTIFLTPHEKYTYITSTIVKEVASFSGDVSCFVPEEVNKKLKDKFNSYKLVK